MRRAFTIIIYSLVFLTSCHVNQTEDAEFEYDPTIPYPILNPGDLVKTTYWKDVSI